jgi:anti-sigma regulatory factor (Ser/Thr protein kinase)
MLEQDFNAEGLHMLREAVLAHATAAGMPESRATEVMLVAHELASNAIRHGGGTGRLRVRVASGALHCQVTDQGIPRSAGYRPNAVPDPSPASPAEPEPWPYQRGHGLWLIREAADQLTVITGPRGSQVDVSFNLAGGHSSARHVPGRAVNGETGPGSG